MRADVEETVDLAAVVLEVAHDPPASIGRARGE
jgi:hypothetical protein